MSVSSSLGYDANGQQLGEDLMPTIFAPGVISERFSRIYRGSFTPDGKDFYFFRKLIEGREQYRILVSSKTYDGWSAPVIVDLGGDHSNMYPTVSPDGSRMVFTSYRPAPGDSSSQNNANLWYVDKQLGRWGDPVFMDSASTFDNYDSGPEFLSDGSVRFVSIPEDRSRNFLVSEWDGLKYKIPVRDRTLEPWDDWSEEHYIWSGTLSPDGNTIILGISELVDVEGRQRRANPDLWISQRRTDGWGEPTLMSDEINSSGSEGFVVFSPGGSDLYFVRNYATYYRIKIIDVLRRRIDQTREP